MTAQMRTAVPARTGSGLPIAIERVAREDPDAIAVEHGDARLSYAGLLDAADNYARLLLGHGVRRGDVVAVSAANCLELASRLLGVLAAGAAYLPLDPDCPAARTAEMLSAADVRLVLSRDDPEMPHDLSPERPGLPALCDDDLAAVLFTSGSTGRPKPVGLTHGGLLSRFADQPYLDLRRSDRVAQLGNVAFDILSFELWGTLLAGATVVGFDAPDRLSGAELAGQLDRRGVTVAHLTSAWFAAVGSEVAAPGRARLRALLFGGEAIAPETVRAVAGSAPGLRLVHLYGPTETTSFATAEILAEPRGVSGRLPIGRPLPDTDVFVLDPSGEPAPIGVPGEVVIGGHGVARGYLGQPAATAERFVPHPMAEHPGGRAYRTGDLARWRHDGRLEFLGRFDTQVKLRGHRIEPQEVESQLRADPRTREAIVLVRGSGADARLVGYVVPADPGDAKDLPVQLITRLSAELPSYLVPAHIVVLDRLPLTERGKIDRKALPAPGRHDAAGPTLMVAPRSTLERRLADLFRDVLGVEEVSVHDSFFQLGGHSVLAMQLAARMSADLDLEVPMRALFDLPTVALLAEEIEAADEVPEPARTG